MLIWTCGVGTTEDQQMRWWLKLMFKAFAALAVLAKISGEIRGR